MCQTVPAQQKRKFVMSTVFHNTNWVYCLPNVCWCVYIWLCAFWIICGVHPLHKCSFQGFGKSPCTGNKKLQRSDPVLADISQNIVGHSRNKKLPSYGNSACMLKPHRLIQSKSFLSPLASFHFCIPCLHIPLSCAQSFRLFSLSDFLLTCFNFSNPLLGEIMMLPKHSGLQGLNPNQFSRCQALVLAPLRC